MDLLSDTVIGVIGKVIDKVIPDKGAADAAKLQLLQLQQQGDLDLVSKAIEAQNQQTEVNKAEAQSDGWYKGGWRPLIGYVFGFILFYNYIIYPVLIVYLTYSHPTMSPPKMPIDDNLWELMFGMLGLGGMRMYEKVKRAK